MSGEDDDEVAASRSRRKFLKIIGAIAIAGAAVGAGAYYSITTSNAARSSSSTSSIISSWEDQLVIGLTEKFTNDDPNVGYSVANNRVQFLTMGRLWVLDDQSAGNAHSEIADSFNTVTLPDGRLALQVKIHPGLKFQDGTPIDANAVNSAMQRVVDKEPAMAFTHSWKSIEIPDSSTINMILDSPLNAAQIIGSFSQGSGAALASPSSASSQTGGAIRGAGPYMFNVDEYVPGEKVVIDRWEDYPFKDRFPIFKHIVFKFYGDASTLRLALQSKEIDIALRQLGKSDIADLSTQSGYLTNPGKGVGHMRFMFMNQRFKPLDQAGVRQAIAYALDIDKIMNATQLGLADRAYSTCKTTFPYYNPSFQGMYTQDVTKAKQLLSDAGVPNGFSMDFYWSDHFDIKEVESNIAALIQQDLAAVGISLNLKYTDWGTYVSYRKQGTVMPMGFVGWLEDYPDIDSYTYPLLGNDFNAGSPWGWASGINIPQMNQLLEAGRQAYNPSTTNDPNRASIYKQIQDMTASQVLNLPFWYSSFGVAMRDYVQDYHKMWCYYQDDFTGVTPPPPSKKPEPGSPI